MEYHSTDDASTRAVLKQLADAYVSNAKQYEEMAKRPQTVVIPAGKSAISIEEYQASLEALGHRVQRLESPVPSGRDVALARR